MNLGWEIAAMMMPQLEFVFLIRGPTFRTWFGTLINIEVRTTAFWTLKNIDHRPSNVLRTFTCIDHRASELYRASTIDHPNSTVHRPSTIRTLLCIDHRPSDSSLKVVVNEVSRHFKVHKQKQLLVEKHFFKMLVFQCFVLSSYKSKKRFESNRELIQHF